MRQAAVHFPHFYPCQQKKSRLLWPGGLALAPCRMSRTLQLLQGFWAPIYSRQRQLVRKGFPDLCIAGLVKPFSTSLNTDILDPAGPIAKSLVPAFLEH